MVVRLDANAQFFQQLSREEFTGWAGERLGEELDHHLSELQERIEPLVGWQLLQKSDSVVRQQLQELERGLGSLPWEQMARQLQQRRISVVRILLHCIIGLLIFPLLKTARNAYRLNCKLDLQLEQLKTLAAKARLIAAKQLMMELDQHTEQVRDLLNQRRGRRVRGQSIHPLLPQQMLFLATLARRSLPTLRVLRERASSVLSPLVYQEVGSEEQLRFIQSCDALLKRSQDLYRETHAALVEGSIELSDLVRREGHRSPPRPQAPKELRVGNAIFYLNRVGIDNPNNLCYFISVLQLLRLNPAYRELVERDLPQRQYELAFQKSLAVKGSSAYREAVQSGLSKEPLKKDSPTTLEKWVSNAPEEEYQLRLDLQKELRAIFRHLDRGLWVDRERLESAFYLVHKMRASFAENQPRGTMYDQQDAVECLTWILDKLGYATLSAHLQEEPSSLVLNQAKVVMLRKEDCALAEGHGLALPYPLSIQSEGFSVCQIGLPVGKDGKLDPHCRGIRQLLENHQKELHPAGYRLDLKGVEEEERHRLYEHAVVPIDDTEEAKAKGWLWISKDEQGQIRNFKVGSLEIHLSFANAPPVITFQFKRYSSFIDPSRPYGANGLLMAQLCRIDGPIELDKELNLAPFSQNSDRDLNYRIHSIIEHRGGVSLSSGHYTLYQHLPDGRWLHYNDDQVRLLEQLPSSVEPYLATYQRIEP